MYCDPLLVPLEYNLENLFENWESYNFHLVYF